MTSTLIVRPVARCDLNHPLCPYSVGASKDFEVLHPHVLRGILENLDEFVFDEGVITCPNPLIHPKFTSLASVIRERTRKLSLLTPITGLNKVTREALELVDELVIVSTSADELIREEGRIKGFLSQGMDNLAVYATVTRKEAGTLVTLEHVNFCRKYGISLRVGELPYVSKVPLRLREVFIKEGYEVSIPYGVKYGYAASIAFIGDYKVTILERPIGRVCRTLFIDYYGRVGKCPYAPPEAGAHALSKALLRKIIYSNCPASNSPITYVPEVRISLRASNDVVIPPDILALLEVIESTNSLRAACRLLGYNPSTYVEKLRSIERRLGIKLVSCRRGGSSKGLTLLTDEGMKILTTYRRVREAIMSSFLRESISSFAFEY